MKVIDIRSLRNKKSVHEHENKLWEFEDYYEYCFSDNYEETYDDFITEAVQIEDYFINLLNAYNRYIMVSILFPKSYSIQEIVTFLDSHTITFNKKDQTGYFINQANEIKSVIVFKGFPIAVASIGKNKLYYSIDELSDITDTYEFHQQIVNPQQAESVDIGEKMDVEKPPCYIDDTEKDDWLDAFLKNYDEE